MVKLLSPMYFVFVTSLLLCLVRFLLVDAVLSMFGTYLFLRLFSLTLTGTCSLSTRDFASFLELVSCHFLSTDCQTFLYLTNATNS